MMGKQAQFALKTRMNPDLRKVHSLHAAYGPIVRIGPNELSVADLPATRDIHRVGSPYLKAQWYSKFTAESEPGIFAMRDPKDHARRRKLFGAAFARSGLARWEGALQERTSLAVRGIRRDAEAGGLGGKADILKWWTFMATDVIAELGFGESFGALENGEVC